MKISVITTAYNHQDTLQRAIDSVNMQLDVELEHIIIDDTLTQNGMMKTFLDAFNRCTGDYISFCDGDDEWTDKNRLKRQVEYMDDNTDCGFAVTRVDTLYRGVITSQTDSIESLRLRMTFDNLLRGSANIYAQGYIIRKSVFDKYIDFDMFSRKFNTWDFPILLTLINHTRFEYLDFVSAIFNKNEESVTMTRSRLKRAKYKLGTYKIIIYFILKYGCKISTITYLIYKFIRDIYSIIFVRWNK